MADIYYILLIQHLLIRNQWTGFYMITVSVMKELNINSRKINVNDIVLVYDEMVTRHFWRIAIVTGVLSSRDPKIRRAIVGMAKANINLKRPVSKLFIVKNTYHDTNQTDRQVNKSQGKKQP